MTTNTSFSPRKRMYIDRLFQWWFRTQAVIWSWNLSVAITSWYIFTLLYFEHHLHYILRILYTIMYMHIQYSIFYILYSIFYILYFIFYVLYTTLYVYVCINLYFVLNLVVITKYIFTQTMINVLTDEFSKAKHIGCNFHWKQCLRRRLLDLGVPQVNDFFSIFSFIKKIDLKNIFRHI